ncbi:DJ-1/PfpI family protein [Nostoc sp. CHAB 5715]|uniref:DJ-1/PfpI family protein n=1 Tax=Nostoc sp. CHAB 5715 TaxID=2780400 RepID=UPI001E31FC2F|nr:DJ-1/PfpI family protein [Nostoc sp. CHAB 5715]MCC5621009.1 DJ-1/PfpI family protein [Nostoc sp. CHAB 5715]
MTDSNQYNIGLLIYPGFTQLDVTGPYQVFSSLPTTRVHLIWRNLEPVKDIGGLILHPTNTFADCPQLDVICVPGGGMNTVEIMRDFEVLTFLKKQANNAQYITSVCTGSLILAAAGLLQGYKAGCHWMFRDCLASMGVEVSNERVVVDRNRITGGGVTAGIDFGLVVAAKLCGEETAKFIQLLLEYNPAPPFNAGSPETAGAVKEQVKQAGAEIFVATLAESRQAAIRLGAKI